MENANFEDIDLSKVLCQLISNICNEKTKYLWTNEQIMRVDNIITQLGEECDNTLEVANKSEKEILDSFHKVLNGLINSLPEITFPCPAEKCGRKFKNKEALDNHLARRHPELEQ